jgi:alcohol dehydrogenase (cytochrome c)
VCPVASLACIGRMEARDAMTGKMVWTRPTVEGHMGYAFDKDGNKTENGISGTLNASWKGDLWQTGGAATWNGATYDAETNLIFAGTGNPAPWNSHLRPGDNLFSSSTVALNPDNGKIVWHYQTTPHDGWDFDGVNEFVSFDYKDKSGKMVKAGGKADRNGFFFVNDRTNGKLLNAFPFVNKITWAKRFGQPAVRSTSKKAVRVTRQLKPMARRARVFSPHRPSSVARTSNRWPTARKPVCSTCRPTNGAMDIWNEPVSYKKGAAYLGAGFTIKALHDDYIGSLRAFDPTTGKIVWESKNFAPLWGGVLTTGGNLVFHGTPEGYLKALDAKTGKEAVEIPDRLRRGCTPGHLGNGWRAVHQRRAVRLGWCSTRFCGAATSPSV